MVRVAEIVSKLISAWPLVGKRTLAQWRLFSSVVAGVLLASVIMAGTVIYFDALRALALENALSRHSATDLDILVKAERGPTSYVEYERVARRVGSEVGGRIGWLIRDSIRGGRSTTFYLRDAGGQPVPGPDNARAYFFYMPGLPDRVTLQPGGRLPQEDAIAGNGDPLALEAIIPARAAGLFSVGVGDSLQVVPTRTDTLPYARVVVSGIYRENDPADPFWHLNRQVFEAVTGDNFRTIPFYVSEKTYMEVVGGGFTRLNTTYGWHLDVDTARLTAGNATQVSGAVRAIRARLGAELFSFRQITSLDSVLTEFDQRLLFSKLQMFVVMIFIAVVVLYYVVTISALVAEQRRGDIALLRGRGASSAQVLAVFALEGASISALAAVLAPVLAAFFVSLLGFTPALTELSGGHRMPVSISGGAYAMSALGGLLSFGALMIPAVQASRASATRYRHDASRPARQPFFYRYYLDVMLLVVSLVLFRQLTEQGSVAATGALGQVVVNQLLLVVPAIMLVATAMVLLRLFPLVMDLGSRVLSARLPVGPALGVWQMARNPTHYARLSLLLILMAGLGIFAASFGGTLERSFDERVLYSSGSDIRLSGVSVNRSGSSRPLVKPYEDISGVEQASAAYRGIGSDLTGKVGETFVMFAADTDAFADVAWFREDFAGMSLRGLMAELNDHEVPGGVPLPDSARSIAVLLKPDRPYPTVEVAARMRDANGRYLTYILGRLTSNSWRMMEAQIYEGRNLRRDLFPARPLTLVSLVFYETNPQRQMPTGSVVIDEIVSRRATGEVEVVASFSDISEWTVLKETPDAFPDRAQASAASFRGDGSLLFAWAEGSPMTSRGIFHGQSRPPVPVLASSTFLRGTGHSLGDEIEVSVSGRRVPVRLVEKVDFFPTLDAFEERFLVADLTALSRIANLGAVRGNLEPNEVWLSTSLMGPERQALVQRLREGGPFSVSDVHDVVAGQASQRVDPVAKAGWSALLLIAFAAVLVLSSIGFLVHAYVSFRNRQLQFALMRTIGVSTRQLVALMWVEQALVIGVGMALGTWMGGRLGSAIMPFLGHDDRGGQVLPPFVIEVSWSGLLVTYLAMGVIFALIIVGVIVFVRRMALTRVLRLGEF